MMAMGTSCRAFRWPEEVIWVIMMPTTFSTGSTKKIVLQAPPQENVPGEAGSHAVPTSLTNPKPRPKL